MVESLLMLYPTKDPSKILSLLEANWMIELQPIAALVHSGPVELLVGFAELVIPDETKGFLGV